MIHKLFVLIAFAWMFCGNVVAIRPTSNPTTRPTARPTATPSAKPTPKPSAKPSTRPTASPTTRPTRAPTARPTIRPTSMPTAKPTQLPTVQPTEAPSDTPTTSPSLDPTNAPTIAPSDVPSEIPTQMPSLAPTVAPTDAPSLLPTATPSTMAPSLSPTVHPTRTPTIAMGPTVSPTRQTTPIISFYTNITIHNSYSSLSSNLDNGNLDTIALTTDAVMGLLLGSTKVVSVVTQAQYSGARTTYDVFVTMQTQTELNYYPSYATTNDLYSAASTAFIASTVGSEWNTYTLTLQSFALNNGNPDLYDAVAVEGSAHVSAYLEFFPPTFAPSAAPTISPSIRPTAIPTRTRAPTMAPTIQTSPLITFYTNVTVHNSYSPLNAPSDSDSRNTIAATADAMMGLLSGSSQVVGERTLATYSTRRQLRSSSRMHVAQGSYDVMVMLRTQTELGFYPQYATSSALYDAATTALTSSSGISAFSAKLQTNARSNGNPDLFDVDITSAKASVVTVSAPAKKSSGGSANKLSGGAVAGIVLCVLFFVGVVCYLYYTEVYLKQLSKEPTKPSRAVSFALPMDDSQAENPIHDVTL